MSSSKQSTSQLFSTGNNNDQIQEEMEMGLNELQTLLRKAVEVENYKEASRLKKILSDRVQQAPTNPNDTQKRSRLSWIGLGTAPWLVDRLEALKYILPTTIQIHSLESINSMLSSSSTSLSPFETLEERYYLNDQSQPKNQPMDMSVVLSGSTGSGKTLAYLVPLLSTLSEALFTRQRIRVKAEEDLGDEMDDLLARVAVTTSPTLRGQGRSQVGGNLNKSDDDGKRVKTIAMGAALSSLGKGDKMDVRNPLALIVVPTRELGVQTAMLLYELVGGSTKKTALEFSGAANMFKYKGPKGVKIGCILDAEEAVTGLKLQTDIAITTPKYLPKLLAEKDILPSKLRVICVDEADLAMEQMESNVLKDLFLEGTSNPKKEITLDENGNVIDDDNEDDMRRSRLTFLVGASVTEALASLPVKDSILPSDNTYIATSTSFAPLDVKESNDAVILDNSNTMNPMNEIPKEMDKVTTSLRQLRLNLDPGLVHERCVAPNNTGLLTLCRLLRQELKEYSRSYELFQKEQELSQNKTVSTESTPKSLKTNIEYPPRPKVVIFFPDEKTASSSMSKLRDAMWGDHKLCVLLPETGINPLTIMEQFKTNQTSVMLATSNSVRGLDFEGLTHVYTLYLPADDPREYVHLAGRVGRIGQVGSVSGYGGRVTSILKEEEADKMIDLADALDFEFVDVRVAQKENKQISLREDDEDDLGDWEGIDIEDMRRQFEDTLTLLDNSDDNLSQ